MPEAPLEDSGSGLAPAGDGWFVVNVRDAQWIDGGERREAAARFGLPFREPGVLVPAARRSCSASSEPGQPNGLDHAENQQEAFLVLSGECRLLVEGEERLLRPWDFFHSPAGTEHIFVGAGDGPCVILMAGARSENEQLHYSVSELAARYGASVDVETTDFAQVYARFEPSGWRWA